MRLNVMLTIKTFICVLSSVVGITSLDVCLYKQCNDVDDINITGALAMTAMEGKRRQVAAKTFTI